CFVGAHQSRDQRRLVILQPDPRSQLAVGNHRNTVERLAGQHFELGLHFEGNLVRTLDLRRELYDETEILEGKRWRRGISAGSGKTGWAEVSGREDRVLLTYVERSRHPVH